MSTLQLAMAETFQLHRLLSAVNFGHSPWSFSQRNPGKPSLCRIFAGHSPVSISLKSQLEDAKVVWARRINYNQPITSDDQILSENLEKEGFLQLQLFRLQYEVQTFCVCADEAPWSKDIQKGVS